MKKPELLNLLNRYKCITIAGLAKNTGKTSVLSSILSDGSKSIRGVTSIGYDGESIDQVTGTEKPNIYVNKGTLIATAERLLPKCDFTKEFLRYTGFNTPMGEVMIVRALSDGYSLIAGPSTRSQMESCVEMLQKAGAEQILIDGAASRKSTTAIGLSDACILATGAAFSHRAEQIIEETAHFAKLLSLPVYPDDDLSALTPINSLEDETLAAALASWQGTALFLAGAITSQLIKKILNSKISLKDFKIIGEDGTRFLIEPQLLTHLTKRGIKLFVKQPINLIAITLNPTAPDGTKLDSPSLCKALQSNLNIPVIDIKAQQKD